MSADKSMPQPAGAAGQFRVRAWTRWAWLAPAVLVLGANAIAVLSLGGADLYTWTLILVYGLFATSTNVLFGWVGRASFGQAAFFGAGAYATALLRDTSTPALLALLAGLAAGVLLGVPVLALLRRSSGITFAMITLVSAQILYQFVFTNRALGGETGLSGITVSTVLGIDVTGYVRFSWYIAAVVAVAMVTLFRVSESSFGLSMRAIRDDETKAAIMGIPVRRAQAVAFLIAGGLAGLAGAMLAQVQTTVSAGLLFWTVSGNVVIMCLLGGRYRYWGPFLGAAVFVYVQNAFLQAGALSDLIIGLVFLGIVMLVPDGILGAASPSRLRQLARHRHGSVGREAPPLDSAPGAPPADGSASEPRSVPAGGSARRIDDARTRAARPPTDRARSGEKP